MIGTFAPPCTLHTENTCAYIRERRGAGVVYYLPYLSTFSYLTNVKHLIYLATALYLPLAKKIMTRFVSAVFVFLTFSLFLLQKTHFPGIMASKDLPLFISTMEKVYGPFKAEWKPKNFAENKSRYLWTDAFGVVNFLTLFSQTKDSKFLESAKILVQTVHETLGRTRGTNPNRLGRATDEKPLLGGLR